MSQDNQEKQDESRTRAGNTYGPAHVSGNAAVHQGDVVNALHIQELHVHLDSYAEPLRLSHPVARLSQYGLTFLKLGRHILQQAQQPELLHNKNRSQNLLKSIESLRSLVAELQSIKVQLSICVSGATPSFSESKFALVCIFVQLPNFLGMFELNLAGNFSSHRQCSERCYHPFTYNRTVSAGYA